MRPEREKGTEQSIGVRRAVVAAASALALGAAVVAATSLGVLPGPVPILLLGIAILAIPSARRLSARVALNGAILLGAVPMLWWAPWAPDATIGRAALLLGLMIAGVAFAAIVSPATRSRILRPRLAWVDLAIPVAAAFCAWFFLPFFRVAPNISSVSMVMQGFGNDNVAHLDMFEMIRRFGVTGPGWPLSPDGTLYAYVPYPQHFHAFAAFVGDLWAGPSLGPVASEVRLFGIASAVSLSLGFVVVVASLVTNATLRRHPAIAGVVVATACSFLLLGRGAETLGYGFPNFLLGLFAVIAAIALSVSVPRERAVWFAAMAALIVFAAHSWILLAPLAAIGPVLALTRVPWRDRSSRASVIPIAAVVVVAAVATAYGVLLVLNAVRAAGSPADALATRGAVALNDPPLTLALVGACLAIGAMVTVLLRRTPATMGSGITAFATVAFAESVALIAVQLRVAGGLDYFQHKFLDGVELCAATLLAFGIGLLCCGVVETLPRAASALPVPGSVRTTLIAVLAGASVITLAGLPLSPAPGLDQFKARGLAFRETLYIQAVRTPASFDRVLRASEIMADRPCPTPIYLAGQPGDRQWGQANQWAMSFSASWSEASASVNSYLFGDPDLKGASTDEMVRRLLRDRPSRCVVTSPAMRAQLSDATLSDYGGRILTWAR